MMTNAKCTPTLRRGEAGNVFIIIMVAVILFAALMFTFTRSARQGGENISDRQAEIAAADILDYAQNVERAVQTVLQKDGVSESDLDFDTDHFRKNDGTAYATGAFANSACTTTACKVYAPAGGNFSPSALNVTYFANSTSLPAAGPAPGNSEVHVINLTSVGTAAPDLVLEIPALFASVCAKLNKKAHITGIPVFAVHGAGPLFTGDYTTSLTVGTAETAVAGQTQFCASTDGTALGNTFFYVLLAR